ncbi:MAG: D-2-hydroxyacid dehydrogenase [Phaeodactylibacter xiamenensis]|uniref:Glycerate dehydrogenase n=1 Tax=Phaeodactylibacter xiamenensis TaxID=1524460 RepID=A0A098S1W5_9BACT|nr:D-2-hydroxyacid dehydrogenase [Phaeodactylibacter xiamenensis]KGE85157.1 glycerate dehydrogenase [Phaeodactylibacter xiamenensis]MCR9051772.1 D-2-hydroxyacid dehydrogenase [bacterium]
MKIIALDGRTLNPGDLSWEGLSTFGEYEIHDFTPKEQVVERGRPADILLVNKVVLGKNELAQLPNLNCICVTATGYNNVDLQAARERGIPVCNAVGYSTDSVAQHVFALLLALTNKVYQHHISVQAGEWQRSDDFAYTLHTLPELAGKIFGIYGFGRIGQRVADLAQAFGMKILATHKHPERDARPGVEFVSLEALFEQSDVISLHAPLSEANREIVNAQLLQRMKTTAYLINTGRGGLIQEADLKLALQEGQLAGAALDVLSTEPPKEGNVLISAPNCILTPHLAWASLEARQRLMDITLNNIRAFQAGAPQNVVN